MGSNSCSRWLKRQDRYTEKVSLSYKGSSNFSTSCGGIATIINIFLFAYFLITNVFFVLIESKFSRSQSERLVQDSSGAYPLYEISSTDQLFIAYSLNITQDGLSEGIVNYENLGQYVQAMFIQETNLEYAYYPSIPCSELFTDQEEITPQFLQQITYM